MKILVPIFICAILPMVVVLITSLVKMNADNKRSQVLTKAIEMNPGIDAEKLAESLKKPVKTPREILNLRLLRGCVFTLGGIALIVAGCLSLYRGVGFDSDPVFIPLMFGIVSVAVGLSYLIVYRVTGKQVNDAKED